jgi:hypothetical protein
MRTLNGLLTPQFSPVGSNRRIYETAVYTLLCKYMRQVAGKIKYLVEKSTCTLPNQ